MIEKKLYAKTKETAQSIRVESISCCIDCAFEGARVVDLGEHGVAVVGCEDFHKGMIAAMSLGEEIPP